MPPKVPDSFAPQVRGATPRDAQAIYDLICDLATYERARSAVRTSAERIAEQLASSRPPFECLLCEAGGEVAGFCLFFPNYSTWEGCPGLYIEDLYVRESLRRRGLGRALFLRVCQLALERGCARVEWAALNWNNPAIAFYRSFEAEALDEWTTFRLSGSTLQATRTQR